MTSVVLLAPALGADSEAAILLRISGVLAGTRHKKPAAR